MEASLCSLNYLRAGPSLAVPCWRRYHCKDRGEFSTVYGPAVREWYTYSSCVRLVTYEQGNECYVVDASCRYVVDASCRNDLPLWLTVLMLLLW